MRLYPALCYRWISKVIRKRHESSVTSLAWHPNNVSLLLLPPLMYESSVGNLGHNYFSVINLFYL